MFIFQVPFGAVALKVLHVDVAPAHILYALNASWVGLCQVQEELPSQAEGPVLLTQTPICDCLGFGKRVVWEASSSSPEIGKACGP